MSTPSRQPFTDVIDILTGRSPPPVSRFLSYSGKLSPQQIQGLADAIKVSSVQGGFRLKGCLLGDSGAEILASALASNRMIHTLELVGNGIGRPGAEAFAACLTTNTTLTSLDVADNPCEWDAADLLEAIDAILQRNRRLASRNSDSLADFPTESRDPSASPRDQSGCPQSESPGSENQPLAPPDQPQHQPLGSLNQSPSRPSIAPASHRPVPPLSLSGLGPSKSARDVVPPSGKENRAGTARTSATSGTSPVGANDFEHRLLYLETASDNVSREIARMREDLTQVNEWEQRVDTLSNEVAAVFASVQTEQTTFRTWFDDLTSWQQRSESECQRFSGELASFGGDLHSLYQHVTHMGSHVEDKAASTAYHQAQEVWDKCNVELEELHSRMHEVWQAHDELVFITGAADGVTGQGLDSRLRALEHDMQQVHVKTEELDRHINKMLTKMVEFANQEQLRLKYDHNELKDRVAEAEQKVQDNLSGQHQDRAAFKTLQGQVGKLEAGDQRLQQQTAGMAEALEDVIRRKSPSVLWQLSQEAAVQDAADRLTRLEKGLVDANSYAETEAVQSQQAAISSMQAQLAAVLQQLGTVMTTERPHDEASDTQPTVVTDDADGAAQAGGPCCDEMASVSISTDTVQGAPDAHVADACGTEHSHRSEEILHDARGNNASETVTGSNRPSSASVGNTRKDRQLSDSHCVTCGDDNNIGCRGADAFAEVLHSKNFTLTTLELTGNPCEAFAPHAIELITTCLRRNRLGLNNASPNTPTKSVGGFATPSTAYHTVQPFGSSNSPESKEGGSAKRVLQTSGKENWVVSTSRGNDGGALGSVGMGAIELEYRLQHLESSQDAISSEVDHIKALGSNIEGWKHQMNDAGAQAAAVLALVQSDGSEIRARLSDLDNWRVNVESASQHFDTLVGGLRSNWFHLEQRFDQISNRIEHRGRTPRAIDCSPYQQQVQQVREQCQQQLELLHANFEEVQQAQQALAASSGVGRGPDADLDVHARLEALGQDMDDIRGVTHRLERYVEQMLRQMLGSLNAGQAVDVKQESGQMGFLEGQQRLKVDQQHLTDRIVRSDKQQASVAQQLQQSSSGQNQIKAALRNMQKQVTGLESGQGKLQQEVTDLGQVVEQMKGRKGPALPWQRAQEQAVQKLQEKITKVEAHSSEALRAVQAESARAIQAEAARCAQTEAVVDSLLTFKQTQSAELAQRDNAIASLHDSVAQLQVQLQRQQLSESAVQAQLQREGSTEKQTSGVERQVSAAERPQSASSRGLSSVDAMTPGQAEQASAHLAATSQQGQKAQASKGSLKGRARLSIDRKKDLQRAAGKAAVRLGGQKPAGARRSLVAEQYTMQYRYCGTFSGLSRTVHEFPTPSLRLQPDAQLRGRMPSPSRSVTPLLGSISAEGLQELLAASLTLAPAPSSPDAQDANQGSQSNEALQQQVVQQQADIRRDRGHLMAPVDFASPIDSPSISRSPSPPLQRTESQPATKLQVGKAASIGSTRVTGSKRTLSSRSNQDSTRSLVSKRVGSSYTAGRSSIGVGRSSIGVDRSSLGGTKGRTCDISGRSGIDVSASSADAIRSAAAAASSSAGAPDLRGSVSGSKDPGRSSQAGVATESVSVEGSPARLHHTAPVVQTHKQGAGAEDSPASDIKREKALGKSKEGALRRGGVAAFKDKNLGLSVTTLAQDKCMTSSSVSSPVSAKQAGLLPQRQSLFKA
ncbi:MAG: hypothetical protein FRX49_11761 [Trebouxia sp. A1-2]|nr:MAG: hypothetical protein FRX49_11761 [Trebouxia sp. A1-2]